MEPFQVVERTALASGEIKNIVSLIKSEADAKNWERISGSPLHFERKMVVSEKSCSLIREVLRYLFADKVCVSTV